MVAFAHESPQECGRLKAVICISLDCICQSQAIVEKLLALELVTIEQVSIVTIEKQQQGG